MKAAFVVAALMGTVVVQGQLLDASKVGPLTSASDKAARKCDVTDYGAVADGSTDIGAAISKAFTECVTSEDTAATLYVPEGEYVISTSVKLNDASNWAFQLDGLITLDLSADFGGNALVIERMSDFEMFSTNGQGAIQGNGYQVRTGDASNNARLVRFINCTDYAVHDLLLIDSPTFHMVHNYATNLELYHITVRGGNKGGLDGIDLICTSNCYVHHVEVTNRDECISVKTPSKNVLIEDIFCNQSGGMSIGSLDAADGAEVEYITMRRVYIHECTQMLMIKTWPGGSGANGYVRNSVFEDFWAYDTTYALDIDQYWDETDKADTGAIELSSLLFRNWTGTVNNGVSRGPIVIRGSDIVPLTNITLEDFGMWTVEGDTVVLQCKNVYGSGYCVRELEDGASATAYTTSVTLTTTMSGFTSPTSPAWGLASTGYGTTQSIPVYTPAAFWEYSAAAVQGGSAAAATAAVAAATTSVTASAAAAAEATPTTTAAATTAAGTTAAAETTDTSTPVAPATTTAAAAAASRRPGRGWGMGAAADGGRRGGFRRWEA